MIVRDPSLFLERGMAIKGAGGEKKRLADLGGTITNCDLGRGTQKKVILCFEN